MAIRLFENIREMFRPLNVELKFAPVTPTDASYQGLGLPKVKNENNYADAASNILWAYVANRLVAETCAMLPLKLYGKQVDSKGRQKEITSGIQYDLFNRPSNYTTPMEFRMAMFGNYAYSGNSYIYVDTDAGEMWPLKSQDMAIAADMTTFVRRYIWRPNNLSPVFVDPFQICHVKSFNPTSYFYGLSPLQAAWSSINNLDKDDRFWEIFWKEGGRLFGMFTTDGTLSETSVKRLKEQLKQSYGGYRKMNANMVLDSGLKFDQLGVSQKDAQLLEKSKASRDEVLAAYKVPPGMVGVMEYANYSNMEVQERVFYQTCILPTIRLFEEALGSHELFSAGGQIEYKFDLCDVEVLKQNELTLAEIAKIALDSGQMTANEVRQRFWKLPPLGDGNVLRPLGNITFGASTPGGAGGGSGGGGSTLQIETSLHKELADDLIESIAQLEMPKLNKPKIPIPTRYSVDFRELEAKKYDALLNVEDNNLATEMRKIFQAQKEIVLSNIRAHLKAHGTKITKDIKDDLLKGLKDKSKDVTNALKDSYGRVMNTFGEKTRDYINSQAPEGLNFEANWNFTDPRIEKFIKQRSQHFGGEINDETIQMARDEIAFLYSQDGSVKEVADGISAFFEGMEGWRAMRIARTETAAAAQESIETTYQINHDVIEGKEWVTSRDDKVRDSHQIDGQAIALDDSFILNDGEECDYPLDPSLSGANSINCRCTTVPILNFEK